MPLDVEFGVLDPKWSPQVEGDRGKALADGWDLDEPGGQQSADVVNRIALAHRKVSRMRSPHTCMCIKGVSRRQEHGVQAPQPLHDSRLRPKGWPAQLSPGAGPVHGGGPRPRRGPNGDKM